MRFSNCEDELSSVEVWAVADSSSGLGFESSVVIFEEVIRAHVTQLFFLMRKSRFLIGSILK